MVDLLINNLEESRINFFIDFKNTVDHGDPVKIQKLLLNTQVILHHQIITLQASEANNTSFNLSNLGAEQQIIVVSPQVATYPANVITNTATSLANRNNISSIVHEVLITPNSLESESLINQISEALRPINSSANVIDCLVSHCAVVEV